MVAGPAPKKVVHCGLYLHFHPPGQPRVVDRRPLRYHRRSRYRPTAAARLRPRLLHHSRQPKVVVQVPKGADHLPHRHYRCFHHRQPREADREPTVAVCPARHSRRYRHRHRRHRHYQRHPLPGISSISGLSARLYSIGLG